MSCHQSTIASYLCCSKLPLLLVSTWVSPAFYCAVSPGGAPSQPNPETTGESLHEAGFHKADELAASKRTQDTAVSPVEPDRFLIHCRTLEGRCAGFPTPCSTGFCLSVTDKQTLTSGQSNLTKRSHRCRTWTVHLYSPGCANVHPPI